MSFRTGRRKDDSTYRYPVRHPSDNYRIEVELTPEYMKWAMEQESKNISKLEDIMKPYILENPLIFVGCPEISNLVYRVFDKLGYDPEVKTGKVEMWNGRDIQHAWIEVDGWVVETNPSQIFALPLEHSVIKVMPKNVWYFRTNPRDILDARGYAFMTQTEAGEKFLNNMAEEIAKKMSE